MDLTFDQLVAAIRAVDDGARAAAGRRMQQITSLRAWMIGTWIVVFEQRGADRAAYGERLFERLSERLSAMGHDNASARNLRNFRQVAITWPQVPLEDVVVQLALPGGASTVASTVGGAVEMWQTSAKSGASRSDPAWARRLFEVLTFSHLVELARVGDPEERAFYESYAVAERWSIRELIRQKNSLLYQRVAGSEDREAVIARAREGRHAATVEAVLRDPYVLEFLGVERAVAISERDLESALIRNLQSFLLELGRDFCFVGQQVRVTVGNRHHFVDLLFFHRRLRCLVAVDLKVGEFEPAHAGQMRFYLRWLAEEMTHEDENPPVGLILCSSRDAEVVHYATMGDPDLFVRQYLLALPSEGALREWLQGARARAVASLGESEEGE